MAYEDEVARRRRFEAEALPHLEALYRTAVRLTRNTSDAEDLVQETYFKAYRFWDRYEPGTHCKAWLLKILTNTRINQAVKEAKQPPQVDFDAVAAAVPGPAPAPDETPNHGDLAAFAALLDDEFAAALEQLPEEFLLILLLYAEEGYAYKEIATILDIPIGTVMSRLFRARKLLQTALRGYARRRGVLKETNP